MEMSLSPSNSLDFLSGGGELGALIRAYDWNKTPLGPPKDWPQPLKTTVRLMLSTGHPMHLWWGPELINLYNDAYCRLMGPEQHPCFLGQPAKQCWADIWLVVGPQTDYVMAGKGHTWHENHLVPLTRNGIKEDAYWTYSYCPIDDPDSANGVGGMLSICAETTEQVLAEQRMQAAEARWRALFDQAPGFMCILNGPEHRFEYANPACRNLIGQQNILGKTLAEVIPDAAEQGLLELMDHVFAKGESHQGVETPIIFGKAELSFIDFVYQPIKDKNGKVTGIMVDGYDVSARVKANEALRDQDRRKDEFLAMLAHELRNPLAPISNASELITQSAKDHPHLSGIGNLLARQVAQLSRLMDDLLDISRITQDRITLKCESLNLSETIKLSLGSLDNAIKQKRHKVTFEEPKSEIFMHGDMTRIIQCITNLLNNSIKYTDPEGAIHIALTSDQDWAEITFTDNGCGIAPDMLDKIFGMFVQVDRTLDRSQGGLGIGLSIVHRMVLMHSGDINVESQGLGQGSRFTLRFPRIATPKKRSPSTVQATNIQPKRVLLVDDNSDAADTLAEILQFQGHQVVAVYNAEHALLQLGDFAPEVVLLDIGLPDMNGYDLARNVRGKNPLTTLIVITGYGQSEDIAQAKEAGFDFHFTKPVALKELMQAFQEF